MTDQFDSDVWIISGRELDAIQALRQLETSHPELRLEWQVAPATSLVAREPQRDLSVVEIIVTAVLTKAAEGVLSAAYEQLKKLLEPKKAVVKKKRKPRKR